MGNNLLNWRNKKTSMPENQATSDLALANQRLQQELAERKRAEMEAAQLARELSALHTATVALLRTLDLEALLGQILDAACSAIPSAEKGMLYLVVPKTGNLEMRAAIGYTDPRIQKTALTGSKGYVARAVRDRQSSMINDVQTDPLIQSNGKIPEIRAIQSVIVAPLALEDRVLGVLSLDSSRRAAFKEADLRLLESFATTATIALNNAQLHAEVQKLAITDGLTNLYNRRGFFELGRREVERSRRFGRPLSAIMIDVDDFKRINDTYGHAAGDQVLRELARRLLANTREVDILGRYGGDEFALLLPETDLFTSASVAERLWRGVGSSPFQIGEQPLSVTISLGTACAASQAPELGILLEQADAALYKAKATGQRMVMG